MIATTEPVGTGSDVTVIDVSPERISWGAIIAGSVTALTVMLVLSLIGMGIGLSTLDPQTNAGPPGSAIGAGAVVWWIVSSLVSFYVGGLVAGRAAGTYQGALHGIITWATVTILSLILLTSAIGGALSGATGLAQFATNLAPGLKDQISATATDLQKQMQGTQSGPDNPATNPDVERQARDVGQKAVTGGAMGAFGAAAAMVMAGIAAAFGGHVGRKQLIRSASAVPDAEARVRV